MIHREHVDVDYGWVGGCAILTVLSAVMAGGVGWAIFTLSRFLLGG